MLQLSTPSCWLVMHHHGELICAVHVLACINQSSKDLTAVGAS